MRLIVMGQQAFGREALARILEAGRDEVVAVYCAPDKEGRPVDPLKELVLQGASTTELKAEAIRNGMKSLRMSGIQKLTEGITTIEEVLRETADM